MKIKKIQNEYGTGLVEVIMAAGVLLVVLLGAMSFFENQIKSNNFLEMKSSREQLRLILLDQVLKNPLNCKCLFNGAAQFPAAGIAELTGFTQAAAVGKYDPADCSGGVPRPFVSTTGVENLRLTAVNLRNITLSGGSYSGDLVLNLESMKPVLGPKDTVLSIPVAVATTPAGGGQVAFQDCSLGGPAAPVVAFDYSDYLTNGPQWTMQVSVPTGAPVGLLPTAPSFKVHEVHNGYACSPLDVVTIARPSVTNSTRAALIGFWTMHPLEPSHLIRVFTMADQFVGAAGQAGRGGDGESWGSAAELIVPLNNKQFKMQTCQRDGDSTNVYYAVKGTLN